MPFSFPYKKQKLPSGIEVFRPTIPIEISHGGKSINFVAIVDSGSDISYMPQWIAEALEIKLRGKEDIAHTVNGKIKVIEVYVHVTIRHKNEVERFTIPIDIPIEKDHTDEIILGRKGLFDRFDITFKENSRRIILSKSRRY